MAISIEACLILPIDVPEIGTVVLVHCAGCEKTGYNPFIAKINMQNPIQARAAIPVLQGHMQDLGLDHELTFLEIGLNVPVREVSPPLINGRKVIWLSPNEPEEKSDKRPHWFVAPDRRGVFH